MANLNFQQPPRSIANSGIGGRVGSGYVTPTFGNSGSVGSGSSSSSNNNNSSSSGTGGGALSPGRSSSAGGNVNRNALFGQRAFNDRRVPLPSVSVAISNAMSSMAGLSRYTMAGGGSAAYHSVFGGGGDTSTPPLLDLSEFPSLTTRGAGDHVAAPHLPGAKPYVGMVKAPASESSEFQMSSEDFPALPGTAPSSALGQEEQQNTSSAALLHTHHNVDSKRKLNIQTHSDGMVTNIPPTMIPNQFGIVGLLTFIRAAESDPSLVSLALGQDLTALGLNLNSPDNLYLTFAGPWAEIPCRPQDMDCHVPPEYVINNAIREKLAPFRLDRYKEDLLFYLFYCFVGDVMQIAAACELYNREWRYHTEEKVWISQAPGMPMLEKTSTYERGTYYFFDAHNWRKVTKEFHLDYAKLEGRPQLPAH